jgi:hypothetical protein
MGTGLALNILLGRIGRSPQLGSLDLMVDMALDPDIFPKNFHPPELRSLTVNVYLSRHLGPYHPLDQTNQTLDRVIRFTKLELLRITGHVLTPFEDSALAAALSSLPKPSNLSLYAAAKQYVLADLQTLPTLQTIRIIAASSSKLRSLAITLNLDVDMIPDVDGIAFKELKRIDLGCSFFGAEPPPPNWGLQVAEFLSRIANHEVDVSLEERWRAIPTHVPWRELATEQKERADELKRCMELVNWD